jgi:hypothetical protein
VASWEEARRCPKCGQPGNQIAIHPGGNGGMVHTLRCENERCTWYNTTWIVQVLKDGSIPERKAGPKQYPDLSADQEAAARRYIEQTLGEQELGAERPPGIR